MASAHQKQIKKGAAMYVYKLDTGSLNKAQESNTPETTSSKKANSLMGSWGLRRSKTVREVTGHGGRAVLNDVAAGDHVKEILIEARKSVGKEARKSVGNEARKSVSHLEVNVGSVTAFLQVKVLVTDMPGFMQVHAFRCARTTFDSLETFSSKQMAYNMKKEFDKVYGPAWHCIVGSSFGSFVTHSTGCFLYFSMEKLYILVFKTRVQRALQS